MIDSGSSAGTAVAGASPGAGQTNALLAAGIVQNNTSLGRLYRVDPANGSIIQSSSMNTVNTRTIILSGTRIFAIAGINKGNGAIRLVEIDGNTLDMLRQGDDDISPDSLLWINGSNLYAITVVNKKNYLTRFDTNLAKQAQSDIEVHPFSSCIFQGDKILTQDAKGNPLLLNGQTLVK
jgi:outer membrane protein assembly factor BamB